MRQTQSGGHLRAGILLALLLIAGCSPGQDSWKAYSEGLGYDLGRITLSENCEHVYFSSPKSGHGDLYRSSFDNDFKKNWEQLTTNGNFENCPVLSPDGQTMAFCREQSRRAHIWIANRDGADERQLTSGSVADLPIVFSPDGEYLIVERIEWAGGKGNRVYQMLMRVSDGSVVYSQEGVSLHGFLSSDELIYTTGFKSPEIKKLNLETEETELIAGGFQPEVSPDGKLIAYAEDYTRSMVKCHIADVNGKELATFKSIDQMVFSGDSELLLYVTRDNAGEKLWRMTVDGKQKDELFSTADSIQHLTGGDCGYVFAVSGTLYAVDEEGKVSKLGSVLPAE